VVWNKIYAKKVFENLRFPVGKLHEDDYMINKLLAKVDKIVYLPDRLYMYRYNAAGITGTDNISDLRHIDFVDAYCERIRLAVCDGRREFATSTLRNGLIKLTQYYKLGGEMAKASHKEYRRMYNTFFGLLSLKQKLKYGLFLLVPEIYVIIYNP
jgi:hypothetical protein